MIVSMSVSRSSNACGAVKRPRVPIVVAGHWPYERPIRRAPLWDGYAPLVRLENGKVRYLNAEEIRDALSADARLRGSLAGFEMIAGGCLEEPHAAGRRARRREGRHHLVARPDQDREGSRSSPDELLCLVREAAGRVLRPNQNLERSAEDKEAT